MLPCPSGILFVMLTNLHWLLRVWLSLNVHGPTFRGRASKDMLISEGGGGAAVGGAVEAVAGVVVAGGVGGVEVVFVGFLIVGVVESSFLVVGVGLVVIRVLG